MYKSKNGDAYVVFGDYKIDDMSAQAAAQQQYAAQLNKAQVEAAAVRPLLLFSSLSRPRTVKPASHLPYWVEYPRISLVSLAPPDNQAMPFGWRPGIPAHVANVAWGVAVLPVSILPFLRPSQLYASAHTRPPSPPQTSGGR